MTDEFKGFTQRVADLRIVVDKDDNATFKVYDEAGLDMTAEFLAMVNAGESSAVAAAIAARHTADLGIFATPSDISSAVSTQHTTDLSLFATPSSVSTAISTQHTTDNTVYAPRTDRLARAAALASVSVRSVMSSPPTVTTSTSADGTLTKQYLTSVSTAQFAFRGGRPVVYSTNFIRFPVVTLGTGSGNVGATGSGGEQQTANGWAAEFVADASTVQIHVRNVAGSTAMVEVDGQPVSGTGIAYPATDGNVGYIKLAFGSRAVRRIRVEGAQNGGFAGVSVGPTETIWHPRDTGGRLVVVGDSLTAQTGAILPNGGCMIEAAKNLGFSDCWEIGLTGTGWVNEGSFASTFGDSRRVSDVVAASPDLLILPTSSNDTAGAGLQAAMLAGFQAYRTALPRTPIICIGVPTRTATVDRETSAKAAFDAWADGNSWWIPTYGDLSGRWIDGTGTTSATASDGNADVYVGSDAIHLSPAGHVYVGMRLARAIMRTSLFSPSWS